MLFKARQGDEYSRNVLIKKYLIYSEHLVNKLYVDYDSLYLDKDELLSVASDCILKVLKCFDSSKGLSVYSYWKSITLNKLVANIRKNYQHNKRLQHVAFDERNGSHTLRDSYLRNNTHTEIDAIEEYIYSAIEDDSFEFKIQEQIVIRSFLQGMDFKTISKVLQKSLATTYRIYRNAVSKLRQAVKYLK